MVFELLVLLVLVLVVAHPLVQWIRQREIGRRLEQVRSPDEAAAVIDAAISRNEAEAAAFRDWSRYR